MANTQQQDHPALKKQPGQDGWKSFRVGWFPIWIDCNIKKQEQENKMKRQTSSGQSSFTQIHRAIINFKTWSVESYSWSTLHRILEEIKTRDLGLQTLSFRKKKPLVFQMLLLRGCLMHHGYLSPIYLGHPLILQLIMVCWSCVKNSSQSCRDQFILGRQSQLFLC